MSDNQSTIDETQRSVAPGQVGQEELKQQKKRNLAIALGLGGFIILVFVVTISRLGGAVAERTF